MPIAALPERSRHHPGYRRRPPRGRTLRATGRGKPVFRPPTRPPSHRPAPPGPGSRPRRHPPRSAGPSPGDRAAGVPVAGGTSTAPVASANTVSPSSGVWAGRMCGPGRRGRRSPRAGMPPGSARRRSPPRRSSVFSGAQRRRQRARAPRSVRPAAVVSANSRIRSAIHGRPVARSTTSPAEFTTTTAPTVTPDGKETRRRPHAALEHTDARPYPGADRPDRHRAASPDPWAASQAA